MFAALTFVVWHRQLIDLCSWLICTRVEAYRPAPPPPAGLRVAFITTLCRAASRSRCCGGR